MQCHAIDDRLLYRRQFVIGPRSVSCIPRATSIKVGRSCVLTAHPDLHTKQVTEANRSLTLLGFILDPQCPDADDHAILKRLLPALSSPEFPNNFLERLFYCGGRWVLIADNGEQTIVVNDTLGQRQVYYMRSSDGEVWCGAQPGILAALFDLEPSQEALNFVDAQKKVGQEEYWFPHDKCVYEEIKMLVPNHYLDLATMRPRRFWPAASLPKLSLRSAVKSSAKLLKALMHSAANRYPLEVLTTCGWDSRVVLAASKQLNSNISFFTFDLGKEKTVECDITSPARLLPKLGKNHRVTNVPPRMNPEFEKLYFQNVSMAHECWGPVAEAMLKDLRSSDVRVTGSGSETVRQQYRPPTSGGIDAKKLATFARTKEQYAVDAFEQWLGGVPKDLGFDILDLFYWEQKCGQWLAVGQMEWDLVGECFEPFNCRALLATLLSTDVAYRVEPHYELYRALLKELWPETLAEPVNPHKKFNARKPSLRATVKDFLVKSHLIEFVR
jgi:hypothetical protein